MYQLGDIVRTWKYPKGVIIEIVPPAHEWEPDRILYVVEWPHGGTAAYWEEELALYIKSGFGKFIERCDGRQL